MAVSLLAILATTLYPYNFAFDEQNPGRDRFAAINFNPTRPDSTFDVLRNVLLFIPLGFGLSIWLSTRGISRWRILVALLVTGLGCSVAVESLQLFLSVRASSMADLLANGLGAWLGYLCFRCIEPTIPNWTFALYTSHGLTLLRNHLLGIGVGYGVFVILGTLLLLRWAGLHNWDPTFHLLIGNEKTGDRLWRGEVRQLYITEKAPPPDAIQTFLQSGELASLLDEAGRGIYCLECEAGLAENTAGTSNLNWQERDALPAHSGERRSPVVWFETEHPVTNLVRTVAATSTFTMFLTFATDDTQQAGPARIVSVSRDPYHRNITVGQQGADLRIRIRTFVTTENGDRPEYCIPDVFTDLTPHNMVIVYSPSRLQIYMDGASNIYSIVPAADLSLVRHLFSPKAGCFVLQNVHISVYWIMYYLLVFSPLGAIVALVNSPHGLRLPHGASCNQ